MFIFNNEIFAIYGIQILSCLWAHPSLVPRPPLDLPAFNVVPLFACNIKSWEIEKGPGDEARHIQWSTLISAYGAGPPKVIGLTEGHGGEQHT